MSTILSAAGTLLVCALILLIAVAIDHQIEVRRRKRMDAWRKGKK